MINPYRVCGPPRLDGMGGSLGSSYGANSETPNQQIPDKEAARIAAESEHIAALHIPLAKQSDNNSAEEKNPKSIDCEVGGNGGACIGRRFSAILN